MEQDRTNHVEGNRLSPFLTAHPSPGFQRETRSLKFQNGSLSAERAHLQVNGENKYAPYRHNYGYTPMKANQKNCISPDLAYEKNENPEYMQNGGIKRTSSDPCLVVGHEQIKKVRGDGEVNGEDGDPGKRQEQPGISNLCNETSSERNTPEEKEFTAIRRSSRLNCSRPESPAFKPQSHQERNINYNSDFGSLFKNKPVMMSNGANNVSASSMENVHGELLQKRLSHYNPERISIAMQKTLPHANAINPHDHATNKVSPESPRSSHTSGQIISPHNGNSELQQVPAAVPSGAPDPENSSEPPAMLKQTPNHDSQMLPAVYRDVHSPMGQAPMGIVVSNDIMNLKMQSRNNGGLSEKSEEKDPVFKQNPAFRKDLPTTLWGRNSILRMGTKECTYRNQSVENFSEAMDGADRSPNRPKSQSSSLSQRSQSPHPAFPDKHRLSQEISNEDSLLMLASLSALQSFEGLRQSPDQFLQRLQAPGDREEVLQHYTDILNRAEPVRLSEEKILCPSEAKDPTLQAHLKPGWMEWSGSSFQQGASPQRSNQELLKSVIQSQSHAEEHVHLKQHSGSPDVLKGVTVQHIHNQKTMQQEQMAQMYKRNMSPLQHKPAAEQQPQLQRLSPLGPRSSVDSALKSSVQQRNPQWCLDHPQHEQQVECDLGPQIKQQHLIPQTAEAEPFSPIRLLPQSQRQCPSPRLTQIPDQQHIFKAKQTERLSHPLAYPHIKSEPQTISQTKLEEFIQIEKQYTKPNQSLSRSQQTGPEQSPHQNSRLSPYSQVLQASASSAHHSCSDSAKKENAVIRELFSLGKTEDNQHMQCYPNNVAPSLDKRPCFQEAQQQLNQAIVTQHPLQPKQEYGSLSQDHSNQQATQSPQSYLPQSLETPPPAPDQRGSHLRTVNHREVSQKHAALRWHLLQKLEQQKNENCHKMRKPIKVEASSQPNLCVRTPAATPDHKMGKKAIKQENRHVGPANVKQRSIIETMEQQLKQFQVKTLFNPQSRSSKSPKHAKVETSGSITVLSAHASATDLEGRFPVLDQQPVLPSEKTPTKRTAGSYLNNFIESPSRMFDTPIKNLLDTPVKTQYDFPSCNCVEQIIEKDEGPYYTHLGAGPSVAAVREIMEERFGQKGDAIRIEKVIYTGKEGKSSQGCPIAKWVIRRSGKTEKLLCLVRERAGHTCETAVLVIVILVWEGISQSLADNLYNELTDTLPKYGAITTRRCALNEERTCACQGLDPETCGASFSFGCSWSMYYNGCKFARSKIPRKFKLLSDDPREEEKLEANLQNLSTLMAPTYKQMAPDAFNNQIEHEHRAPNCRLGLKEGRPFSGVTACLDFCAHSHRDLHNMQNGSTLVCTLTREDNREIGKIPEDEQLHVLPLYRISTEDEFGRTEGQEKKVKSGAIQVLHAFRRKVRMQSEPVKTCRQKKMEAKKAATEKISTLENGSIKSEKEKPSRQKHANTEATAHAKQLAELLQLSGTVQQQKLASNPPPVNTYPSSDPATHYMRRPTPSDPYQSSPIAPDHYGGSNPLNIFGSPSHSSSSYLNSSNPMSPYPASLNQNSQFPAYQCNGSVPTDACPPYVSAYPSHPQHMDLFRCQSQDPLSKLNLPPIQNPYQQRYGSNQTCGRRYMNYGNENMPVDSFSGCSPGPNIHHAGSYNPYPSHQADPSLMQAGPKLKATHNNPAMDYTSVNKNGEYTPHPPPYQIQGGHSVAAMFGGPSNSMHLQKKDHDMHSLTDNGICNMLPALNHDRTTPFHEGLHRTNGANIHENMPQTPIPRRTPVPEEPDEVWSDSEQSFMDSDIGGVAVAPTHGSILIECAKRELHATTPLKNPNRNHPTRISLVFYQHKSMNEPKHGLALWEAKMAGKAREKEEDYERYGPDYVAPKSNHKKAKREPVEVPQEPSEQTYMRFIKSLTQRTMSVTTTSTVTTSPYAFTRVTGPYNRYI